MGRTARNDALDEMVKQPKKRTSHSTKANARFESLKEWILVRPNVSETYHKFGGTEFQLKGLEFMHNHGPRFLDIRLSKGDQSRVLKEGKARRHRASVHHNTGWVSFSLQEEEDLERAKHLIQMAYRNAKKELEAQSTRRTTEATLNQTPTATIVHG